MDTKLTLRIKKNVIEKSKQYALIHKISLSKMIETYLESLTENKVKHNRITPLVENLSGVIQLDNDFDHKKGYTDYLIEKYKWRRYFLTPIS